jgi:hypothetical protein
MSRETAQRLWDAFRSGCEAGREEPEARPLSPFAVRYPLALAVLNLPITDHTR